MFDPVGLLVLCPVCPASLRFAFHPAYGSEVIISLFFVSPYHVKNSAHFSLMPDIIGQSYP